MKNLLLAIFIFSSILLFGQTKPSAINALDSSINNLIHTPGYITSEYGAIPEYIKAGKGKQTLILIPGWGFDASVFEDFMEVNKKNYTMYAITIPGYGKTMAPPMPPEGTSYGEQNWSKGVISGLVKLIEKEKIHKPIIVGHFTQSTQLALRMAIDYPDKISGVIILGGQAKFISMTKGEPKDYPLERLIVFVDKYSAPKWFKPILKKDFDKGNYLPAVYSLDSIVGARLWKQSAAVPLPVMIRYLCEFTASDVKAEMDKIKCPVLVLRSMFNNNMLKDSLNNYVRPQFMDTWNDVSARNSLIKVQDVPDAATFIWKDRPKEVYSAIKGFLNTLEK